MATDRQLLKEFKSIGKDELGYDGDKLTEFMERSLKEHKEEKAREKERQKEIELARLQEEVQAREKAREREHILAMERLRLEAEFRRGEESNVRPDTPSSRLEDRRPIQLTMPMFNDRDEIIDNFLTQFEKLALVHQIPKDQWAINISAFLQGAAKDVYHNMTPTEIDDYDALKKALLRHYELSAETFRKLFRESSKRATETHAQFHSRVRVIFDKWMKMSGTALTYEGIREEILKEHVLSTYRKDLIVFLAEREFSSLDEISVMAERYESAHARPTTWNGRDRHGIGELRKTTEVAPQRRNGQNGGRPGAGNPSQVHFRGSGKTQGVDRDTSGRRGEPVCYGCNKQAMLSRTVESIVRQRLIR